MSDAEAAPAAPAVKKTPKKKASKPKKPSNHPKYSEMIKAAITALKVCNYFFLKIFPWIVKYAFMFSEHVWTAYSYVVPVCSVQCAKIPQLNNAVIKLPLLWILGTWRFIPSGYSQVHHETLQRRQGREGRQPASKDGTPRRSQEQLP